ncbi:MAG: DUF4129 domain-containing protein, partial [bacterium]
GISTGRIIQISAAVVLLLVATAVLFIARELNWRVEADVDRSYSRLTGWASYLGLRFRPALTPNERAELLSRSVPEGRSPIFTLTEQYVRQRFSRRKKGSAGLDTVREWRVLRPMLLRRTLRYQLTKIFGRFQFRSK